MPEGTASYSDDDVFESLKTRTWDPPSAGGWRDLPGLGDPPSQHHESLGDPADLWYPKADRSVAMPTVGRYAAGYPVGALVHFTAGRCERGDPDAAATARYGATQSHSYFCISRTGRVYQTAPLDRWGYHSGKSYWTGLGNYVHQKIVGIEVCNAGRVKKTDRGFEPDWNKAGGTKNTYYTADEVRLVSLSANICEAGYYLRYSPEQEAALVDLILWMHGRKPDVFKLKYVVGHDEVSPKRKNDPGGALSMTMPAFRAHLAAEIERRKAAAANVPIA